MTKLTPFDLIGRLRSWFFAKDRDVALQSGRKIVVTNANVVITSGGITITGGDITIDGTSVSVDGHTHSIAHADLTGVTANQHHNEAHTVASHSDTTATGAELETLTNGSNADSLHSHSAVGSHTIASHSDTSATGTELNTLTDGSNADSLHSHTTDDPLQLEQHLIVKEISPPSSAPSGYGRIWFATDGKLHTMNDSGTNGTFYLTSDFSNNPGSSSLPLITNSNGYITLRGVGIGSGTPTANDLDVSGDITADGNITAASGTVSGGGVTSSGNSTADSSVKAAVGLVTGSTTQTPNDYTLMLRERSTDPSAPTSGYLYVYAKSNRLYYKNDAGTVYGPL